MPAAKRKSAEANLENQLIPISDLLQSNPTNDAKRAKTNNQNVPLGDISNSPWPIKWTAFGAGKYVEDPLRPVAPMKLPMPEEKEVEEVEQPVVPPVEAPAKKITAKKPSTKKTTPKANADAAEPVPAESVSAPEFAPAEPEPVSEAAPAKKTRKPAAKKATPKGVSKTADATPVEPVVTPEEPAAQNVAPATKAKKPAAKKATPKSTPKAPEAVPVPEEPVVEAEADTTKARKPAAKKATSKAKAKTTETAPVAIAPVVELTPTEASTTAKKPTKSKAKAKATEEPTPIVEPEVPAPTSAKKSTAKEPKEPAPKPSKAAKNALPDFITTVHLDGQENDKVPVFDTCDVVRRKITGALTSATHTKASLLRAFAACTSEPDRPLPPNSFQRFMAATGKTGGCTNRTFYAAYVYFEKQRIAEKKKKTKTREEMENAWGAKGMDYENLAKPLWMGPGESLSTDQYGRHVITSKGKSKVLM